MRVNIYQLEGRPDMQPVISLDESGMIAGSIEQICKSLSEFPGIYLACSDLGMLYVIEDGKVVAKTP